MIAITFRQSPKLAARIRALAKVWKTTQAWVIRRALRMVGLVVPPAPPGEMFGLTKPRQLCLPPDLLHSLEVLEARSGLCRSELIRRAIYQVYG